MIQIFICRKSVV